MWVYFLFPSLTSSTYIALQSLGVFDQIFDSFNIAFISCINLSQYLQHQTICIDTSFNVHMTDKMTMSVNEWLPHYLIEVGLTVIQTLNWREF